MCNFYNVRRLRVLIAVPPFAGCNIALCVNSSDPKTPATPMSTLMLDQWAVAQTAAVQPKADPRIPPAFLLPWQQKGRSNLASLPQNILATMRTFDSDSEE